MTRTIELPELGEGVEQAEVVSVLVSEGDEIEQEQSVLEVETDKATLEVPSPAAGRVVEVLVAEGEEIEVGQDCLRLETADADSADTEGEDGERPTRSEQKEAEEGDDARERDDSEDGPHRPSGEARDSEREEDESSEQDEPSEAPRDQPASRREGGSPGGEGERSVAAPSVRRFAREIGVELDRVPGSGPAGRVSIADVKAHAKATRELRHRELASAGGEAEPAEERAEWRRLSSVRRTIARRMKASWTRAPQVTLHARADVTGLMQAIARRRESSDSSDVVPGLTAVLVHLLARALRVHPGANAALDESGERIARREDVHVGLAVDTERGLLVPVLREADRKSLVELALEAKELAGKARAGRLEAREMRGGCVTLTNLGGFGIDGFTPILVPEQVIVLGVGRASTMPRYIEDQVLPREELPLSLTFDHRILDGADAARLLAWIQRALEDPWSSLLDD